MTPTKLLSTEGLSPPRIFALQVVKMGHSKPPSPPTPRQKGVVNSSTKSELNKLSLEQSFDPRRFLFLLLQ